MSASAVLKLQKVGFTAERVEALADFMDTQAASKADLGEAVHSLKSQMESGEHRLDMEMSLMRADMRQMEQRIIIKLGGMMVVMVGVVVAIVKLLPGGHP